MSRWSRADPEPRRGAVAWPSGAPSLPAPSSNIGAFRFAVSLLLAAICGIPPAAGEGARQHIADLWHQGSGLPQNYVYAILQTRDGYLWVGTRGGLARFDGVRFTTFDDRTPGQLRDSEVWALAEGPDSALWIGTYGGGLTRLKDGRFQTFGTAEGLPSEIVTSLTVGPDGTLWIGTGAGLARLRDGRIESLTNHPAVPRGGVNALHTDTTGRIWIGAATGLGSCTDGHFENHTTVHPKELGGYVTAIAGRGDTGVWVGLQPAQGRPGGIRVLRGTSITSYTARDGLTSEYVMSIALDGDAAWVGTRLGLYRYHGGRFEPYVSDVWGFAGVRVLERVLEQRVPALALDHEGSLWFGTQTYGLGRLRRAPLLNATGGAAEGHDVDVRSLFEDRDGAMWLGTARDSEAARRRDRPHLPDATPRPARRGRGRRPKRNDCDRVIRRAVPPLVRED